MAWVVMDQPKVSFISTTAMEMFTRSASGVRRRQGQQAAASVPASRGSASGRGQQQQLLYRPWPAQRGSSVAGFRVLQLMAEHKEIKAT